MMYDEGRCRLFRHELVFLRERNPDPLRPQALEEFRLILEARTCGIPETVPGPAVVLAEQFLDFRVVVLRNPEFLPYLLMPELREGFRALDAQPVKVKIILVDTRGEEPPALFRCNRPHGHEMHRNDVDRSRIRRGKKVGDAEKPPLALPWKGEADPLRER